MKKIFFTSLILLSTILSFSCSKKSSSEENLLSKIKEKGEITIAMEGTWAPWTYHNSNNELVGYDVEIGKKIAEKLGVKANFIEADWDGIFAGLDAKRYDIACNGVEITDERKLKYDFSEPYAFTHTALIVKKNNNNINSYEDLKGKKTTNSIGSTYAELAESFGANVITIDSFDQTLELVEQGRADATLNDNATFYYYQKIKPNNNFKIAALTKESSQVAIPMRKGEETASLRTEINNIIEEMKQNGELSEISKKYFGEDLTK